MIACLRFLFIFAIGYGAQAEPPFRFHSSLDLATVDPAALTESSGGYIFYNLYRSLFRLGKDNQPVLDLAKTCQWEIPTVFVCKLKDSKFSNGEPILAIHFVTAWQRLVNPSTASRHSELLLPLVNAARIIKGELPPEKLGVVARSDRVLEITLNKPETELIYRLASPILTPLHSLPEKDPASFSKSVTSGPYKIQSWTKKTQIQLISNSGYWDTFPRPPVEVAIVEDDMAALNLYDLGKLDFLRRLNVKEMPARQTKPDFIFHPLIRFDYLGFGPDLQNEPELRKALSHSLNYSEADTLLKTPGKVGCPTLPKTLAEPWPCVKFDLKTAQAAWEKVSSQLKKKPLALLYSPLGGEDVSRTMEWMQAQWKKHLGLTVELKPMDAKMLLAQLKNLKHSVFRKGVTLDRPTCLAALELFASDSPENFLSIKIPELDKIISTMTQAPMDEHRAFCGQGLTLLINENRLIPLGEMYFAMLAKPGFSGWYLTALNQLDLTHLRSKSVSP